MHLSVMKAGYSGDAGEEGGDHNVVHGQSATYNGQASDVCCKCDDLAAPLLGCGQRDSYVPNEQGGRSEMRRECGSGTR